MKILTAILLSLAFFSTPWLYAQSPAEPTWHDNYVKFTGTKSRVINPTTKKVIFDDFREGSVVINSINKYPYSIDVDCPNGYFIKDATITNSTYEISEKEGMTVTYVGVDKLFKAVSVSIYYEPEQATPSKILIAGISRQGSGATKSNWVTLYDIK